MLIEKIQKLSLVNLLIFLVIIIAILFNFSSFKREIENLERNYSTKGLKFPELRDFESIISLSNCETFKKNILSMFVFPEKKLHKSKLTKKQTLSQISNRKRNFQILGIIKINGQKFYIVKDNKEVKLIKYEEIDGSKERNRI